MGIEIGDRSLMMVFLLEECNLDCIHCVRESEPMGPGYRLTRRQLATCLADCRHLGSIEWVHFSGGEPTLWREGEVDLVDLLLDISKAGLEPGFTTNGVRLEDGDECDRLLGMYFDGADMPLRLYLSIDSFHGNFDRARGRARSLDNVLRFKEDLPGASRDLLGVHVLVTVSKEPGSLLPPGMVARYRASGVDFVFVPLRPVGRAEGMAHLCPDVDSERPEDLGAFARYRAGRRRREPGTVPNIILIGDHYHFSDPWRRVTPLGHLPEELVAAYGDG
jgi:MoaA/NifB/PqqE/SkfB family radical SAM enzyme